MSDLAHVDSSKARVGQNIATFHVKSSAYRSKQRQRELQCISPGFGGEELDIVFLGLLGGSNAETEHSLVRRQARSVLKVGEICLGEARTP